MWLRFLYFWKKIVIKSLVQSQTNDELILLISIACLSKDWYTLFLCVIDLYCCSKSIENISMSHTAVNKAL